MASAGTPEYGSSQFPCGANRITVCRRSPALLSKWTTTAGELVTPYREACGTQPARTALPHLRHRKKSSEIPSR